MDNFQWTDELVSEFAEIYKINISKVGHLPHFVREGWMKNFKESHQPKERIDVFPNSCYGKNGMWVYNYASEKEIPDEKFSAIKQAIEQVLNDEPRKYGNPDINVDWSVCGKKYTEKDLEDAFNAAIEMSVFKFPSFQDYINNRIKMFS
jgi:hypothetical protein